jgi:acetolactate synthase-1/2/3 large subunit
VKVSDYIADFIYAQGVTHVFEVVGGMITHMIDSIYRKGNIRIVSLHHEQAAAFAAEGFARITGIPGMAMATSGPGAINLLIGIGSCYFDSTPAVFITGQVNRDEIKGDRPIRQLGFQETDIVAMAKPITKAAWCVTSTESVPIMLANAFQIALSGRPGPVLLDIPMDIQRDDINIEKTEKVKTNDSERVIHIELEAMMKDLRDSHCPLILAGGGLHSAQAIELFRQFVEQSGIPVISSLMAVDVLPYLHHQRIGVIGTYGNRWANLAIDKADFILVLGSRLDIRQTGSQTEAFKGNRVIYHVDCDPGEINNRVKGCKPVISQLQNFLTQAIHASADQKYPSWAAWISEIEILRKTWPDTSELDGITGINPNIFMHQLSRYSAPATVYAIDVGQHQMWAAQSLELSARQRFMTSGGMGAMGSSLPLAVGTAFARPSEPIVVIAGDGGFQLNIQELQTVAHYQLPIKMIIINNKSYGMVRQFQQSYFEGCYQSTVWGYSAPDFAAVAQAYGIPSYTIHKSTEVELALRKLWKDPQNPFLLQVYIDITANAYPKIAFGLPLTKMEPF